MVNREKRNELHNAIYSWLLAVAPRVTPTQIYFRLNLRSDSGNEIEWIYICYGKEGYA